MDFLRIGKIFAQDYYAVPDYQRDYEWTAAQNSTLLDDIFDLVADVTPSNHFFGAIVTIPYETSNGTNQSIAFDEYGISTDNAKHVVDGQQRLTSFTIMIKALSDVIKADDSVDDIFKQNIVERQLGNILYGNHFKQTYPAPRLILNGNTGNCLNKEILRITDTNYSGIYKGAKRINSAYKLFKEGIEKQVPDLLNAGYSNTTDVYKKIIDIITNKAIFVEIECDASSNAFQVFDSLNGKGLDLTAADRIKNIFMSWSPKGKGAQKWESFVSVVGEDYLASFFVSEFFFTKEKRISKNKLPEEFSLQYKTGATSDFDFFYKQLKEDGELYGQLRGAKTTNAKLNTILDDFNSLGMDQIYVMLFAIAKNFSKSTINQAEYVTLATSLQNLLVRMQICEKSTNKLDTLFSAWIDNLKNGGASINAIDTMIKAEIKSRVDDVQFEKAFASFAPRDSKTAEFYLRHIETYLRKKANIRTSVEKGLTVEHIIPQTLDDLNTWYGAETIPEEIVADFNDNYIEHIGNKMLLYGDDNSSASNNTYTDKINVYKNGKRGQNQGTPVGTFKLVEELVSTYGTKFNHGEVENRAKQLAKYAKEIW